MTFFLAILAGLVGAVLGWTAAAAAAILIAGAMGVSDFEGGRAMLAIWGIGPFGGIAGLLAGIMLTLHRRGVAGRGVAWRTPLVIGAIGLLIAGGIWLKLATNPVLNPNGIAPRLEFEVRLPPGIAAPVSPSDAKIELHTERNVMPAQLSGPARQGEDGRALLAGSVEVYYRSGWRLLEVTVPGQPTRIFEIKLASSPRNSTRLTSWQRAAFVAEAGPAQPRKAGADEAFEIRYRLNWLSD